MIRKGQLRDAKSVAGILFYINFIVAKKKKN